MKKGLFYCLRFFPKNLRIGGTLAKIIYGKGVIFLRCWPRGCDIPKHSHSAAATYQSVKLNVMGMGTREATGLSPM